MDGKGDGGGVFNTGRYLDTFEIFQLLFSWNAQSKILLV